MKGTEITSDDSGIVQSTRQTPYACSSATELSGGLANSTYRGRLSQPLEDGTDSVIIKHGEERCAKLPEVELSTTRCRTEQALLKTVQHTPVAQVNHNGVAVQCPWVYHYVPQDNTQIVQDYPHESTLHQWLTTQSQSHHGNENNKNVSVLGEAVAIWLARFHSWSRDGIEGHVELADIVKSNTESLGKDLAVAKMRKFEQQCENDKVLRYAREILFPAPSGSDIMIHGDFSTRNILLRDCSSETTAAAENTNAPSPGYCLAIIDWEISCYASFTRDVANILSDLYMQIHFTEPEEAKATSRSQFFLNGFISAYPRLSEEVYKTVAQVGENFFYAHAYAPPGHTKDQVEELVRFGERLIVMGCKGDRASVEGTFLGCLLDACW
ncbi:kinase-like domain-containing protein [Aspergillus stella-maris]|uniref:kinase-like domain-containing protein n=1 Tax=Aspergillus stella-maris TaxID=1810926 RepID=UPI003CCDE05B